jgi:hypothetical protein
MRARFTIQGPERALSGPFVPELDAIARVDSLTF